MFGRENVYHHLAVYFHQYISCLYSKYLYVVVHVITQIKIIPKKKQIKRFKEKIRLTLG